MDYRGSEPDESSFEVQLWGMEEGGFSILTNSAPGRRAPRRADPGGEPHFRFSRILRLRFLSVECVLGVCCE